MKYPVIQKLIGDVLSDDIRDDFWGDLLRPGDFFRPVANLTKTWAPKMDIDETEKEVIVSVSVPGMNKKEIKVDISDNVLTISGERKEEQEKKGKNRYLREQFYGSFKRSVRLPFDLKADGAKANYKDGILTITIPKTKENKTKSINID